MLGRGRDAHPAALAIGVVGGLEAFRRRDRAVVVAPAAFLVADAVQRREDLLAQLRAFGEDRLDEVRRRVGEPGQVVVPLEAEDVVQQEQRIFDRRLVARHAASSRLQSLIRAFRQASRTAAVEIVHM